MCITLHTYDETDLRTEILQNVTQILKRCYSKLTATMHTTIL